MALVWFFGLLETLLEVINTMVNEKSPGPAASYLLLLFSVFKEKNQTDLESEIPMSSCLF